ncbi:MAG TPA: FAD-dependent thymidylate synthase, partial [Candidatus Binatia bacterium]|nr:FAD-dependent thymidylate synthase [Candidatus Binatia bacterium]
TRVTQGAKKKKTSDDRALIRNLMHRRHTTPLEMCEIKLHVRTTMDVWRQWVRHRTASINEHSTQYSIADTAQTTPPGQWRIRPSDTNQGGEAFLPLEEGQRLSARELQLQKLAREVYEERIAAGVEREQARKDLPLSTYTEAYWKIDLHNLLHFLHVRMDENAQPEMRAYAELIGHEIVAKWVPLAWEAFLDYRQEALLLTRIEAQILSALIAHSPEEAQRIASSAGLLSPGEGGKIMPNRERTELESKLRTLGLTSSWR